MATADAEGIVMSCPSCGQRTRVRYEALGRHTRCGKCRQDIRPPDAPVEIPSADAFAALTRQTAMPVLVDFWAAWCGPCRAFAPVFEAASEDNPDITFGKVDTEAQTEIAAQFQITSIPTVMAVRDGVVVYSRPGALPEAALTDLIKQVRDLDMDEVRAEITRQAAG